MLSKRLKLLSYTLCCINNFGLYQVKCFSKKGNSFYRHDCMSKIQAFAKNGFLHQTCELLNGLSGFYDYGPYGSQIKRSIENEFWNTFVNGDDQIFGLDSSIVSPSELWDISGHSDLFVDPLVECKVSKERFRADKLLFCGVKTLSEKGEEIIYVSSYDDVDLLKERALKLVRKKEKSASIESIDALDIHTGESELFLEVFDQIPSPSSPTSLSLSKPRLFNLLLSTNLHTTTTNSDSPNMGILRPETAQGMFVNFRGIFGGMREPPLPFGFGQIGKAFRFLGIEKNLDLCFFE